MEYELRGIRKGDHKKVSRALELMKQLEDPELESAGREELLWELLDPLKQLARAYPAHSLIRDIAVLYLTLGGRFGEILLLLERLKNFDKSGELRGILGEAYLREKQLFSAYENFSFYIENAETEVSREYLSMFEVLKAEYEKAYRYFVEELGIDPRDQREHEKAQVLLHGGELDEAKKIISRLARKYPQVPNVMNNMGIILMNGGNIEEAELYFQKVLSTDAHNLFASTQLARTALYRNDLSRMVTFTEHLMAHEQKSALLYYELVQLNALLGRDEELLSLYRSYDQEYQESGSVEDGTIRFFAAVALLRTGNKQAGTTLLRKLQKHNDILPHLTKENLADIGKPEEEQNGPAYYSLQNLFPPFFLPQLMKIDEKTSMEKTRSLLSKNRKMLLALLPVALRSGDELAREYFLNMYEICRWDEMYGPLSSFMIGRVGSDKLRRKAFEVLTHAGKLTGEVEMYQGGEKTVFRTFKVTEEPRDTHFTEAQWELNTSAYYLMEDGSTDEAIDLWKRSLQEYGDEPSVLNNLALAYNEAGRNRERDAVVKKLEEQFPDYFFYKIIKASRCIAASDFEQARTILDSLGKKDEYHVSEIKALCTVNIHYYTKKNEYEAALQWYKTGSICLPDNPEFNDPQEIERLQRLSR
jgi:tetratricopeptide (TPR) repeat protein